MKVDMKKDFSIFSLGLKIVKVGRVREIFIEYGNSKEQYLFSQALIFFALIETFVFMALGVAGFAYLSL